MDSSGDATGRQPQRRKSGDHIGSAERAPSKPSAASVSEQAAAPAEPDPQPRRRGPKKGVPRNRYDRELKHSDPTSLDPEFIVLTGEPVDDEPGRTARLRWTKGRRSPITDEEAANVAWRRSAARLNRVYKSPDAASKIEARKLPPTLEQALAKLSDKLPDWQATRESLHVNVPGRLSDYLAAYADMMNCSVSQLVELWVYEQVRANVRSPRQLRAAYEQMCEETYRQERADLAAQAASQDDDDEDDDEDDE